MKKFNFNMVEIALAMVVIALGISGILGLFSVGVNAKKAAINENNIADAAEYILGLYRAVIVENYAQGTSDEFNIITATKSESYEKPVSFDISKITPASSIYPIDGETVTSFDPKTASTIPSKFLYAQTRKVDGDFVPDCEIAGAVWKAKVPVANTIGSNSGGAGEAISIPYNYGVRVYLELSWPAQKKYDDREKKIFVMDVMNPNPVLKVPAGNQQ